MFILDLFSINYNQNIKSKNTSVDWLICYTIQEKSYIIHTFGGKAIKNWKLKIGN